MIGLRTIAWLSPTKGFKAWHMVCLRMHGSRSFCSMDAGLMESEFGTIGTVVRRGVHVVLFPSTLLGGGVKAL